MQDEAHQPGPPQSASDPFFLLDPRDPFPGVLAVLCRKSRMDEIGQYELSGVTRQWKVRGIVSDAVPLSGSVEEIVAMEPNNLLFINGDPLSIYLHSGGHRAIYYDLVGVGEQRKLSYIEVIVETRFPSNAIVLARRPLTPFLT